MKKSLTRAVVLGLLCTSAWHGSASAATFWTGDNEQPVEVINELPMINNDSDDKRLNDLRTDPSEVGVWIRGATGDTEIRSYKFDYNIISGGYDWHKENNAAYLFFGLGMSYSTNECNDKVIGDTTSLAYTIYGSWLGKERKDYVDFIVKVGELEKEYDGDNKFGKHVRADYDKSLFSIAAKYGRRIDAEDGWYYEPSVGFAYGRTGSADFFENGNYKIHSDTTQSKIASIGVQVGKNIKGIEYYTKFEVKHDFDGEMRVNDDYHSVTDDMGGTWYKFAIGASRKISEHNSFYIDIEKDFGNKVKKPYAIGIGYRQTW